ncbi:MAG: response regulator transcription factor [Candidatus Promineifilaceae bacterium]|nr:response regulator transcription factor [Candidatus Promineifilaceae bacterium]
MNRKTILAIGTEGLICSAVEKLFRVTGANVSLVHDEIDGMREIYLLRPDLIIIDIDVSRKLGVNVLRKIRRNTVVPVIVIMSSNGRGQLPWIEAGADACLSMPFSIDDLLAYVVALLNSSIMQSDRQQSALYDDGHLLIDTMTYQIIVGGSAVKLTPLEFKLLVYLVNNAQEPCSYRQILENVWGDGQQNHREYVHTFIWQLRQKLERNPQESDYIESVHGIGYRFRSYHYGAFERVGNGQ